MAGLVQRQVARIVGHEVRQPRRGRVWQSAEKPWTSTSRRCASSPSGSLIRTRKRNRSRGGASWLARNLQASPPRIPSSSARDAHSGSLKSAIHQPCLRPRRHRVFAAVLGGLGLIDVHAKAWLVVGMDVPPAEFRQARKNVQQRLLGTLQLLNDEIRWLRPRPFLYAEIARSQVDVN